jgi:hypothetical protein
MTKTAVQVRPKALFEDGVADLTLDQLRSVMPKRQKSNITQRFVDDLNGVTSDPEVRDQFRQNLLGYTDVLQDANFTLPGYVQAIKYVSYRLLGYPNNECWIKTFPDRYQKLLDKGVEAQYIHSVVGAYNKGQMVQKILGQSMIPTYILNQDVYQQAINVQTQLMLSAKSEKVRTDAANSLLSHLRQPDETKISLDVQVKEDDSVKELRIATLELVAQQKLMISSGAMNAKEVAEGVLIAGDFKRLEN